MERSARISAKLSPGGHDLRPEVLVHHQRQRMQAAALELVAEQGYRAVTVTAIVKRAAIARTSFYKNYSSKQDCFLAAYDETLAAVLRHTASACEAAAGEPLASRLATSLAALLAYLAAEPTAARACIVEAPALGIAVERRREEAIGHFAALLAAAREPGVASPVSVDETVVGGLYSMLYTALRDGESPPDDLLPSLTEFALTPFLGATRARRAAAPRSPG